MSRAREGLINYRQVSSDANALMVEVFLALGAAIGLGLTAVMLRAGW